MLNLENVTNHTHNEKILWDPSINDTEEENKHSVGCEVQLA